MLSKGRRQDLARAVLRERALDVGRRFGRAVHVPACQDYCRVPRTQQPARGR